MVTFLSNRSQIYKGSHIVSKMQYKDTENKPYL